MLLAYTSQSNIIELQIKSEIEYPDSLTSQIPDYIEIYIENFKKNDDFLFSVTKKNISNCITDPKKPTNCYHLNLALFKVVIGGPKLTAELKLPYEQLILNNITKNPQNSTIKLMDNYITLDKENEEMINLALAGQSISQLSYLFLATFSLFPSSISRSTSPAMRSLMLFEITFLIKYIDLSYPQILREFFYENANKSFAIFVGNSFDFDYEDYIRLPILYRYFRYKTYYMENVADNFIINLIVFGAGIFSLHVKRILEKNQKNKKDARFKKALKFIVEKLNNSFVWTTALIIFLSNYQLNIFHAFCTLSFAFQNNAISKLNLAFCAIEFVLRIILLIYLVFLIFKSQTVRSFNREVKRRKTLKTFQTLKDQANMETELKTATLTDSTMKIKIQSQHSNTVEEKKIESNNMNSENLEISPQMEKAMEETPIKFEILNTNDYEDKGERKNSLNYPFEENQNEVQQKNEKTEIKTYETLEKQEENKEKINLKDDLINSNNDDKTNTNDKNLIINENNKEIQPLNLDEKENNPYKEAEKINQNEEEMISTLKNPPKLSLTKKFSSSMKKSVFFEYSLKLTDREGNSTRKIYPLLSLKMEESENFDEIQKIDDLKKYKLIYKEYKNDNIFTKFYLIFDLIRQCAFAFIVVILRESPLGQIVLLNLVEWFFVIYTLKKKPFKYLTSVISFVVVEILLIIILFLCFLFATVDFSGHFEEKNNMGWTVIVCNIIFRIWGLFIAIVNFIIANIKDCKKKKKNSILPNK